MSLLYCYINKHHRKNNYNIMYIRYGDFSDYLYDHILCKRREKHINMKKKNQKKSL
jgi:hypothetical protein